MWPRPYRRDRGHRNRDVLADGHQVTGADPTRLPDRREAQGGAQRAVVQRADATALADETQSSRCGGFSILSVSVKRVNLPNGTQLWVTLDFNSVGVITL